jgi:hypothetical protein
VREFAFPADLTQLRSPLHIGQLKFRHEFE